MWDFLTSNLFLGLIFLLVIVPLYAKLGLLNLLWNKNGKNNKNELIEEIQKNHLHDMAKQSTLGAMNGKVDVLTEIARDTKEELKEIKGLLQGIKDKPC